jgi:argininosuccinate synthase
MSGPRVVLAHAGDAETLLAIPLLARDAEVVTVTVDVGQGDSLLAVRERALEAGAVRAHVLDEREVFAHQYALPAFRAGAVGFDGDVHASLLALPCIARVVASVAAMEQASALAHGGSGAAAARMRRLFTSVSAIAVRPPVTAVSDDDRASALQRLQLDPALVGQHARVTLWGRSLPAPARLADLVDEAHFTRSRAAQACPEAPAMVDIGFHAGHPRSINGVALPLVELLNSLDTIAAAHGIGRVDVLVADDEQTRREVAEAPAVTVLQLALRDVEALALPWSLRKLRRRLAETYVDLIRAGDWFSLTRDAIDALTERALRDATATVRLRLCKGVCQVVSRSSP